MSTFINIKFREEYQRNLLDMHVGIGVQRRGTVVKHTHSQREGVLDVPVKLRGSREDAVSAHTELCVTVAGNDVVRVRRSVRVKVSVRDLQLQNARTHVSALLKSGHNLSNEYILGILWL